MRLRSSVEAWGSRKLVPAVGVRVAPLGATGPCRGGWGGTQGQGWWAHGQGPSSPLPGRPEGPGCHGVGSPRLRQITLLGHYSPRLKPMLFNWLRVINESRCSSP